MTKIFGSLTALDDVSIKVRAGTLHALLGENGAGKSTLVKCIMGFYQPTRGSVLVDGREAEIRNPRDAHAHGIGMVYQHFTLVPSLTAAENLVISRAHPPAIIDWRKEKRDLAGLPRPHAVPVPLDVPVSGLAAGEKQKLEILKQLYLDQHFLILDEPTSVLTPGEADEVLGLLRGMTEARRAHHPDDHPQVPRGDGLRRRGDGAAPRPAWPAAGTVGDAQRRRDEPHDDRRDQDPRAGDAHADGGECAGRARTRRHLRRRRPGPAGGRGRQPQGPRRRDRRHRRRLGQRPVGAGRGALRPARRRPAAASSSTAQPFEPTRDHMDRFKVFGLPEEPLTQRRGAADDGGREHRLPHLRQAADHDARLVAVARADAHAGAAS